MAGYPPPQQPPYPPQQPGYQQPPPQQSGGGCFGCSMGCVIFLLVLVLLCGGGALYVYFNWQVWAGDAARSVAQEMVKKSGLNDADQARVMVQVDRIIDEFKAGKISAERFEKMMTELGQSPLLPVGIVVAFEAKYVTPSGLPDDEKEAARLVLQRFARGVFEKKIAPNEAEEAIDDISEGSGDNRKMKENLTDDELRGFIAKLKEKADAAMIPEEEYKIDVPGELEKLVDKMLATP